MAYMRSRIALMRAAAAAHQAARTAAHTVDRVHGVVRPVYEAARPLLQYRGIDTSIPDKALSTYDGIRRTLNK
jgi:hypothetical protein